MIGKVSDIETNINVGTAENGNINANFYTEDDGSAYIRITVTDNNVNVDFTDTNLKPRLDLFSQDGSIFTNEPLDIVSPKDGVIIYKVSDNVIKHAGRVDAKLFLEYKTQSVHVANFYFTIQDSGIDGPIGKEVNVSSLQRLVRNVMSENAMGLLTDEYTQELKDDIHMYLVENPDEFKGEKGDVGPQGPQGPIGNSGSSLIFENAPAKDGTLLRVYDSLDDKKGELKYETLIKSDINNNKTTVDITTLGVVGDGKTDDTDALQKALDYCANNNIAAQFNGTALVTDTININCVVDMPLGSILSDVGSKPTIVYGNEDTYIRGHISTLPSVIAKDRAWDITGSTGIKVLNVIESRLTFGRIENFSIGLRISATKSTVYNTFNIGTLANNKVNLVVRQENDISWINENVFDGGRYYHFSSEGTNVESVYQIVVSKPDTNPYLINNNLWVKPSVEGEVAKIGIRLQGVYNTFFNARFEKNKSPKYTISFFSNSKDKPTQFNTVLLGYQSANVVFNEDEFSSKNILQGQGFTRVATSSSNGAFRYQNTYSDAAPLFKLISASQKIDDTSESNYNVSLSPNSMNMKRPTDLFPRLKFDFVTGALKMGDGTKEPNGFMQGTSTGIGVDGDFSIKNHAWNNNIIQLGNKCIWVDSNNDIRVKTGKPTSEFDGKITGR
ncbi:BppU family phage baseplate upper protein [Staphylococcus sp. NRL 16/872]|uniref:BppU family phage baseplate upper protein n=1 Tax=Staphylococcus sp. NRL 16/872 TaxID=2930131 RepID=UPI001FB24065|nr:BppU family phage baseplate upper protein [Staphylococcus sp. NRL 16/872]WEN70366.1 BppU family phage baseplate upper protein [Staphylococcus sp. NRL 16/872]